MGGCVENLNFVKLSGNRRDFAVCRCKICIFQKLPHIWGVSRQLLMNGKSVRFEVGKLLAYGLAVGEGVRK